MKLGDIHRMLRSLMPFLEATQGPETAGDLLAFSESLVPFEHLTPTEWADFLRQTIPAAIAPEEAAPTKRNSLKTVEDQSAITAAVNELKLLLEQALSPTVTFASIDAKVAALAKQFDVSAFKRVGQEFGLRSGLTSKSAIQRKIAEKIKERKGWHERGELIRREMEAP